MTNFNTFADCNVNKYFKNETKPLQCDTDEQWKTFWQVWLVLIEAKWVSAVYARDWVEEIYIEWVAKIMRRGNDEEEAKLNEELPAIFYSPTQLLTSNVHARNENEMQWLKS